MRKVEAEGFSRFEQAVLDKILAGDHPVLVALRAQARAARIASREYTGVGFFLKFEVPPDMPVLANKNFHFGDVCAAVDGLQHGAGFVVFVRDGRLATLEGYSFDESWPSEIGAFSLSYQREPRDLSFSSTTETTPKDDTP